MTIKTCTQCKIEKRLTEFYRKLKAHTSACKMCINAKMAAQREADPDGTRAKALAWNSANREKSRAWAVTWYWANRKKSLDKSAERRRANPQEGYAKVKLWRRTHMEVCAATNAARQAQKLKAIPSWADRSAIEDVYLEAAYMQMVVDHIVPLRSKFVCGLHVWDNLQLLTPVENSSKGNRHWPNMP